MENATVETFDYHAYTGGIGLIPLLILGVILVVPYWKLWSRTGHSGAWALLMLIPLANIISLWVLAFKQWPALRGKEPRA